jgi:hypothetical protein
MIIGNSVSIQPLTALDKFKLEIYNTADSYMITIVSSIINVICEIGIIAARGSVPSESSPNTVELGYNVIKGT